MKYLNFTLLAAVALVAAYLLWNRRGHEQRLQPTTSPTTTQTQPCPEGQHLIVNGPFQGCVP